jgi:hypothetical protein
MNKGIRPRLLLAAGAVAISPYALWGGSAVVNALSAQPAAVTAAATTLSPATSPVHRAQLTAAGSGMAMIFQRPNAVAGLGHVGWGFYDPTAGTWTYGAVEGAGSSGSGSASPVIPAGSPNGAWSATGSWSDMITAMNNGGYATGVNITTPTANVAAAQASAASEPAEGYALLGNNCADATDAVLTAYGITGLPSPDSLGNLAPNSWVSSVQAAFPASTAYDIPTTATDPELYDPTGGLADDPGATDPGDGTDPGATDPGSGDDGGGDAGGGDGGGGGGGGDDCAYVIHTAAAPADHVVLADDEAPEMEDEMSDC